MAIKPSSQYALSYDDQALWERGDLSLAGVRDAWLNRRDPRLAEYIVKLVQLDPALSEEDTKKHQDKFNYGQLLNALRPWTFSNDLYKRCTDLGVSLELGEMNRNKVREVIAGMHKDLWVQVEANPEALPDRLKIGEMLTEMWAANDAYTREMLLIIMAQCPLKYGPWRAMKNIFKESSQRQDWVMFGVIAARLDREGDRLGQSINRRAPSQPFNVPYSWDNRDVSKRTVRYLLRRAWRVLRGIAQDQPSLYPNVAAEVLKHYSHSDTTWNLSNSWLRNHILFHETKRYGAESFYHYPRIPLYGKQAYPELWQKSEKPLLKLLDEAHNPMVIEWLTEGLITEFKTALETLDARWVHRVARLKHTKKDKFLLKWFNEVCPHTQNDYQAQGLHEPLMSLLWSDFSEMSAYALTYFKAHPQALIALLTIESAMAMVRSDNTELRALGEAILEPSAGHFTLTLEQWTNLATHDQSAGFGQTHFVQIFSGKDLSYDWYSELINHESNWVSEWAMSLLNQPSFQPISGDLFSFYWSLLAPSVWRDRSAKAAFEGLSVEREEGDRLLNRLSTAQLRALFLHPDGSGRSTLKTWVKEGWVSVSTLTAPWLRTVLDRESWRAGVWHLGLENEGEDWREGLGYSDQVADLCKTWLLTPSFFTTQEVGPWWLLQQGLDDAWSARAYRSYVQETFPLAYFVTLNINSEEIDLGEPSPQQGFDALLNTLFSKTRPESERNIVRRIIRTRIEALRLSADPNTTALGQALGISDEMCSFEVFTKLAQSVDDSNRALALELGALFYRPWTENTPLTFGDLLPFFEKGFSDVQDHLLRAMSANPRSAEARIDVRRNQFDAQGLYAFCFSAKAKVRDLGLSIIGEHPERFAQPERIALLVESSDRRVCEGVVKLLWEKLRFRSVTTPWIPHAQSVSPQSVVAKKSVEVVAVKPPTGKKPNQIKGRRYLGTGVSERSSLPIDSLSWISDFLTRTLFRLSPTHPVKGDLERLTNATPAWRNKVNLIKAIRDLAVKDQGFARLVKPILEEFMASRGQSERAACLVALTRMRAAHPALFIEPA